MARLTERDIFGFMAENFRLAVEECQNLAKIPMKGPTYNSFRHRLQALEGACRQAAAWRGDTSWLPLGRQLAEVHARAGNWLRGTPQPQGGRMFYPPSLFLKLAELLEAAAVGAERRRTQATGRIGPILPEALPGPLRHRPVQVMLPGAQVSRGGIIMPNGL